MTPNELAVENYGLAVSIASGLRNFGNLDELISAGLEGLIIASQKFDDERGVKFSTYAGLWIRAYIFQHINTNSHIVRMPSSVRWKKRFQFQRLRQKFLAAGLGDDLAAMAAQLGIDESELEILIAEDSGPDVSTDAASIDGQVFGDRLAAAPVSADATMQAEDDSELVQRCMGVLDRRERKVIRGRFLCDPPKSLRQIGDPLGITKERVRQIEEIALRKMRKAATR